MTQPIGQATDPPVGQPNPAGRGLRVALALSLLAAAGAWLVLGLPSWALVVWTVLALAGMPATAWHHRRRALTPLERWALEPKRFDEVPSVAWAALTLLTLLVMVLLAIWALMLAGVALIIAACASKAWAWKAVTDHHP